MLKLCTILLLAVTCILGQPLPPAPIETVWEGMFAPPYVQSPQIALAMDCVSSSNCYIAGAENGQGGGVFLYDGKMDGNINMMNDANMSMIVMDVAMGGTASAPKGVFSGVVDFTIGAGLQYLANGNEWKASAMPLEIVWASQSVAGDASGMNYVAVGTGFTSDLMISNDGGLTFQNQAFTYKSSDNCSYPANLAIASDNLWFLSFGAEPAQHNKGSGSGSSTSNSGSGSASSSFRAAHHSASDVNSKYYDIKTEQIVHSKANGRILIIKNVETGKVRTVVKTAFQQREDQLAASAGTGKCNYYYGEILKSTDKGQTWTMVYQNKNAMTSFISCFDAENCAATIFNADESYVAVTVNGGSTWQITLKTPVPSSTLAISIGNIGYASKTELWAAGSQETQSSGKGMFWSSKDAGMTWTQYPHYIPDVMVITAVSFTPDGVGFAAGMTMFKTTQIMRYKKQADYGTFIQSNCALTGCLLCQNITFPQGMCLQAQGGSAKAICTPNGIEQYMYSTTSCVGSYTKQLQPINKCLNSTNGGFFENYCPGQQGFSVSGARAAGKRDSLRRI